MSPCLSFKRETHKYFYRTVSMDMRQFHKSRLQIMIKCQSFFFNMNLRFVLSADAITMLQLLQLRGQ